VDGRVNYNGELVFGVDRDDANNLGGIEEAMRLDVHGFLGIGTTEPTDLLELSSAGPRIYLNNEGTPSGGSGIYWRSDSDSFIGGLIRDGSSGNIKITTNSGGNDARLVVTDDGKIGIGTEIPVRRFHIKSEGYTDGMEITGSTGEELFRVRQNSDGTGATYSHNMHLSGVFHGDIGPNNGAPFPRAAYDSGWIEAPPNSVMVLTHNIGGNLDNYIIDLSFYDSYSAGRHNKFSGGEIWNGSDNDWGAYWSNLTGTTINVHRMEDDPMVDEFRVRIWYTN